MDEWIYRAAATTADEAVTADLLERGFLCRTAYANKNSRTGVHALIPRVRDVKVGDVIHVALSQDDQGARVYRSLGSFEVLGAGHPDLEGAVVDETNGELTLHRVVVGSYLQLTLGPTSYKMDPRLGVYTGWHVRDITGSNVAFTRDMFPGMSAIHEYTPGEGDASSIEEVDPPTPPPTPALPAGRPVRRIELPSSGSALGVDWSGALQAAGKILAARIEFGPAETRLTALWRPFAGFGEVAGVANRFAGWLDGQAFDVSGLDFCFGVSREHAISEMPRMGPAALGRWVEANYPTPEAFKAALGPERKRTTVKRQSFFPMATIRIPVPAASPRRANDNYFSRWPWRLALPGRMAVGYRLVAG